MRERKNGEISVMIKDRGAGAEDYMITQTFGQGFCLMEDGYGRNYSLHVRLAVTEGCHR